MVIALISCSKEKVDYPCPAHELYGASTLFSLSYQYAKQYADRIYILSAKYGLVPENQVLEPYNQTLKEMSRSQQLQWGNAVIQALRRECDTENDHFVFLAGSTYYRDLLPQLPHYSLPLEGMRMGERLAHLKQLLESPKIPLCVRLHSLLTRLPRYTWEQIDRIPFSNGIYILFEKGELYQGMERIVRVGTHTAPNRLKRRLQDHFIQENHDGSIFRKNIGKAILNAYQDPYLAVWTLDTSKAENKQYLDPVKNKDTEQRVSKYLREHFTFTAFPVDTSQERLRLEEAIIATLSHATDFGPCSRWSGQYSPEPEIRESGLWLKQGLTGTPMTEPEYQRLLVLCSHPHAAIPVRSAATSKSYTPGSCGKYEPLYRFLQKQTADRIVMTMSEAEAILGFPLPKSARIYPMWYTPNGHPHCQAWLQVGYDIADAAAAIKTQTLVFVRKR